MSKRSSRSLSKKNLPKDLIRVTIENERWWVIGNDKFKTLREVIFKYGKK